MNQTHPLVDAYLDRLDALLYGAPTASRAEVVEGVREHLHETTPANASDEQIRAVLAGLGTPEQIADEAYAAHPSGHAGAPASLAREPKRDGRWLPVTVVTLGLLFLAQCAYATLVTSDLAHLLVLVSTPPLWIVLMVLIWAARSWSTREKAALLLVAPLSVGLAITLGLIVRLASESLQFPVAMIGLGLAALASVAVIFTIGRRGLARAE